jgi:hypothetical protein
VRAKTEHGTWTKFWRKEPADRGAGQNFQRRHMLLSFHYYPHTWHLTNTYIIFSVSLYLIRVEAGGVLRTLPHGGPATAGGVLPTLPHGGWRAMRSCSLKRPALLTLPHTDPGRRPTRPALPSGRNSGPAQHLPPPPRPAYATCSRGSGASAACPTVT